MLSKKTLSTSILKNGMQDFSHRVKLLKNHEVLVLSTGYEPLFKTCWKRAISAVMSGRAEIIEKHESLWIGTTSGKIECPTKVRFTTGIIAAKIRPKDSKSKRPSKKALWQRDLGTCQYCSKNVTISSATIDHVIPKSRGGGHTWDNLVIACSSCNSKKGSRLLEECSMSLRKKPESPSGIFLPVLT